MVSANQPHSCYASKTVLYNQRPWTPLKKRKPIMAEFPTPGPNYMPMPSYIGTQVMNSAIEHRPAWSLSSRQEPKARTYAASPASYNASNMVSKGGRVVTPAYTMRFKTQNNDREERRAQCPAPNTYDVNVEPVREAPPAYSHKWRLPQLKRFSTPGPDEYTLGQADQRASPKRSMGLRLPPLRRPQTPSPAEYEKSREQGLRCLPRAPAYSIASSLPPLSTFVYPGPGTYCPEKIILAGVDCCHPFRDPPLTEGEWTASEDRQL